MFFDIQSDLSDINKMMNTALQFFITVDSNCDNDAVIQNLSFVMILTVILEFFKLALDKLQNVFMH